MLNKKIHKINKKILDVLNTLSILYHKMFVP